jgi:hypothetical protein
MYFIFCLPNVFAFTYGNKINHLWVHKWAIYIHLCELKNQLQTHKCVISFLAIRKFWRIGVLIPWALFVSLKVLLHHFRVHISSIANCCIETYCTKIWTYSPSQLHWCKMKWLTSFFKWKNPCSPFTIYPIFFHCHFMLPNFFSWVVES